MVEESEVGRGSNRRGAIPTLPVLRIQHIGSTSSVLEDVEVELLGERPMVGWGIHKTLGDHPVVAAAASEVSDQALERGHTEPQLATWHWRLALDGGLATTTVTHEASQDLNGPADADGRLVSRLRRQMDNSFDYHKRSAQLEHVDSLIDRVVMDELNRLADQLEVDRSLVAADYKSNCDGPEDVHTNGKALRSELRKNHEAATEAAKSGPPTVFIPLEERFADRLRRLPQESLDRFLDRSLVDSELGWQQPMKDRRSTVASIVGCNLILSGADSVDCAERLLARPYRWRTRRRLDTWDRSVAPLAAAGVLLIALVAVGFAPMQLTSRTLWLPALATGGIVGAALGLAIAGGRRLRPLLATLSPPVVVVGFATFYGNRMLSNPPGLVSTNVAGPLRLIEPILLSVGIGTTGGFLDLSPKSAIVRWGALAEMLILVSLVGGTVYSVVAAGLRELRAERRQED